MSQLRLRNVLIVLLLLLLLAPAALARAGDDGLTPEEVATSEREFTYTTAAAVAAGQRAAERYWMHTHVIHEVAAVEREFTYTTAAAVQRGAIAAQKYRQSREVTSME